MVYFMLGKGSGNLTGSQTCWQWLLPGTRESGYKLGLVREARHGIKRAFFWQ
jgi:hypothetical protein